MSIVDNYDDEEQEENIYDEYELEDVIDFIENKMDNEEN